MPSTTANTAATAAAALFISPNTSAFFDTSNLHDPLKLNLRKQVRLLLDIVSTAPHCEKLELRCADAVHVLKMFLEPFEVDKGKVLDAVSRLLGVRSLVGDIVWLFRPLLVDLFARWLLEDGNMSGDEMVREMREERLEALASVVGVYEEVFPVFHEFLVRFFPQGPLHFIDKQTGPPNVDVKRLQRLLLAYFRVQQANRELPIHLAWPLSPLSKLIWSAEHNRDDSGVKLFAVRCYAYQSGMGEAEREKVEKTVLGMAEDEMCSVDCWVYDGGKDLEGEEKVLDGWVVPMLEVQRVRGIRERLLDVDLGEYYGFEEGEERVYVDQSNLCPCVANIYGVLLLRRPIAQECPSGLVPTPTSIAALRILALHISMRVPTLITSSPSAGKSLSLNHLAGVLYPGAKHQIITIHLADTSLDPRSLLGSYISSPVHPGSFEWKEGVLVRAMREGRWVVFEDIDRGSSEVLGVIKPLIESMRLGNWIGCRGKLDVPSRGCVIAHQDFLVFATRSVHPSRNHSFPAPAFLGAHKFCEVVMKAPGKEDLKIIIERKFERLKGGAAESLIELWKSVEGLGTVAGARDVGLRELEKLCMRVDKLLPTQYHLDVQIHEGAPGPLWDVFTNPSFREEIYLEARDVFFGSGATTASARSHLGLVAVLVGEKLGLDKERREWLLKGRVPEFGVEKDVNGNIVGVRAGRTWLGAKQRQIFGEDLSLQRPFAMHRPAVCLLSRIVTSISLSEPILLTGETGTGKTSVITHLASLLGRPLISLNLSHQTESSDLIGGLKPVDTRVPASKLQEKFLGLFGATFSRRKNEKFETEVRKAVNEGKWKRVVGLWRESGRLAQERLGAKQAPEVSEANHDREEPGAPRKRRRVDLIGSFTAWTAFLRDVDGFEVLHVQGKGKFAFGFVEGPLVKALRSGDWVLLDEINLASPETLECISGLLHGPTASIALTEQGSLEPVPRHPDFRLFACMNPATDVGKKDLPTNIRSRFTEVDVPPPDADKDTLLSIINKYIGTCAAGDKGVVMNVAEFYIAVKDLVEKRQLADGANHRPHFSMRTLARALTFAAETASVYSLQRSIWEGCLMAFTMVLDPPSAEIVTGLMHKHLLVGVRNPGSMLRKEPPVPHGRSLDEFIRFGPFYLEKGPHPEDPMEEYVMTPSVEGKLVDLARIIVTRKFPVLIEGPTSSGKTSSIEYLARRTGHRFVRINNHEHTDIQEYLGSYVSDPLTGKLVFKDGLLVHALRNGDWIVLDELNLAPTDVLEALNRLLDDNRELVIPETQDVVRPHPHFMLFATQNPPGLYAGRKILSRAFRNRFLEVHFQDVPQAELESILCQRCKIAPSYGTRIVAVFRELQKRRQAGRVFESKHSFATLRDLFRWANRDAAGYQELADNGYMLLAERARREDDKVVVKEVIQSIMKVQINENALYNLHQPGVDMAAFLGAPLPPLSDIIWTKAMQRLYILVCRALRFNEPVLLVGETGTGKTSVCQVFADVSGQQLRGLNCHQNTETADIIGALRPVRNRATLEAEVFQEVLSALAPVGVQPISISSGDLVSALNKALKLASATGDRTRLANAHGRLLKLQSIFDWQDGPLVEAMRNGDVFLLDEISLADDSVLERLNSVLEPGRAIVLAEKGGSDFVHPVVKATDAFKLVATMNPGGDYGKKELSPALRNRFTEIWVPRVDDRADLELIVDNLWKHAELRAYTQKMLDFIYWLSARIGDKSVTSLRDIIAWVMFSNAIYHTHLHPTPPEIFHHAAQMTYLDGLSSLPQLSTYSRGALSRLKAEAITRLHELAPWVGDSESNSRGPIHDTVLNVQIGSFAIKKGQREALHYPFNLTAPTSRNNAMRILRACQLPKPILLEGSPGVGKTSLIMALANISGHHLCRINLSDQTDLIDLFGSDLPVEGGAPGEFAWRDAEFLKALQEGHWVLLDEMNLAPQAVLEGLNAVLDHRGTVYIPELGRSFTCHPSFRIFAAQNPLNQGGGRKGLPKSFVNRFTKVYVDELSSTDLILISQHMFPHLDENVVPAMISFNTLLNDEVVVQKLFGRQGAPWEFNLRDVIRWGTLTTSSPHNQSPATYLRSAYLQRFRTTDDRNRAQKMFDNIFAIPSPPFHEMPRWSVSSSQLQVGHFRIPRKNYTSFRPERILKVQLAAMEALGDCVSQGWLSIVTGPRDSGKSHLVRALADCTGNPLREIFMNSATDTMDIIGSFEQVDPRTQAIFLVHEVLAFVEQNFRSLQGTRNSQSLMDVRDGLLLTISGKVTNEMVTPLLQQTSGLASSLISQTTTLYRSISKRIEMVLRSLSLPGRFEWVDGPLIQAMRKGEWLLLDGANLCNPSILDRLNSLCEPNGQLTLSERGLVDGTVEVVKPHPSFRLFMTVDPHHGELSRAMRNRGTEIFLPVGFLPDDHSVLLDHFRLPRLETSTDHSSLLSLKQQSLRRGLLQPCFYRTKAIASSGRILDQFSALSNVMDRLPLYITSIPEVDLDATTFFFSRTLHHAYIPYFHRTLNACDGMSGESKQYLHAFLNLLSSPLSSSIINRIQATLAETGVGTHEFLSTQAMDDLVNESSRALNISNASAILSTLDLIAATFLESRDHRIESEDAILILYSAEEISQCVDTFLVNLSRLNDHLLHLLTLDQNIIQLSSTLSLVATLNKCGRYLRGIFLRHPLSHSAIQVVVCMINETLVGAPPLLQPLISHAMHLHEVTALSTGLGLVEMWSKWECASALQSPWAQISQLDTLACSLGKSRSGPRRQVLRVMSLMTLPVESPQHEGELSEIISVLKGQRHDNAGDINVARVTPCISELSLFSGLRKLNITELERFLDIVCRIPREPLLQYIAVQRFLWALDKEKDTSAQYIHVVSQWLDSIWTTSPKAEASVNQLLQPSRLHNAVMLCTPNQVTLQSIEDYERDINICIDATLLDSYQSRDAHLESLLRNILLAVAKCFGNEDDGSLARATQHEDLMAFLSALARESKANRLSALLQNHFEPLQLLEHNTTQQKLHRLGFAWTMMGIMFLDLLIPDAPIDPVVICNTSVMLQQKEYRQISSEISLHQLLERTTTGNDDSFIISSLRHRLKDITETMGRPVSVTGRDDVAQLHVYWAEVRQFRHQVASDTKILDLLRSFAIPIGGGPSREEVLQESITGFCQRLEAGYPQFDDLNMLLRLAMSQSRLGVRLVAKANMCHSGAERAAANLVAYPSVCGVMKAFGLDTHERPSALSPFDLIRLRIVGLELEASLEDKKEPLLELLEQTFDQVLGLWLIDKAKEAGQEAALQSLYRGSSLEHNAMTDAELEEQEFLALFPSFENSFAEEATARPTPKSPLTRHISTDDMILVARLHFNLFSAPITMQRALRSVNEMRKSLLLKLMESHVHELPSSLDAVGLVYQLRFLHGAQTDASGFVNDHSSYNFYKDPNPLEIKAATQVVITLRAHLKKLFEEWPEQMVLRHLMDRCDSMLLFTITSPVAKVLSALEQLLIHTDDWEMYANQNNSLSSHRQALTQLIVRWRQLELKCWSGLLESEAQIFAEGASEWWFRILDATVRGVLNAMESNEEKSYLEQLVPLIEEFISSSPLGQFVFRIRLLQCFEHYISKLSEIKNNHQKRCLHRVVNIIHSTYQYYRLHEPRLQSYLAERRATLDKEIKNLIKLASWKDVNVHALKQSAQRTHHQLYKIARKFRELLREPIAPQLNNSTLAVSDINPTPPSFSQYSKSPRPPIPSNFTAFAASGTGPLSNLNSAFKMFESLVDSKIRTFISRRPSGPIDDLAIAIITTSKELSEVSIPAALSPEKRTKFLKSLLVRKRKAFSDLLKELKRIGLSGRTKADILRQNSDTLWLREQPIIASPTANIDVEGAENYFSKLCGCLPELRSSLAHHHHDLQTSELQRGTSFLESGFSMAIDLRARLAAGNDAYVQLRRAYRRMVSLTSSEADVFSRCIVGQVCSVTRLICRLSCALTEVIHDLNNYSGLQALDSTTVPMGELEVCLNTCNALRDNLIQIRDDLTAIPVPALRNDEYATIIAASEFLESCVFSLGGWATSYPRLRYLFEPVKEWLSSHDKLNIPLERSHEERDSGSAEPFLNTLLYTVQVLVAETKKTSVAVSENEDDHQILKGYGEIRTFTHLLSLERVLEQLDTLLNGISTGKTLQQVLQCIVPFLDVYQNLVQNQLTVHAQWMKAIFKLDFVLCSTFLALANQGFCQPPEAEESGGGDDEALEAGDGTGLGEGSGTENINEEIDDESQLEGLKGEDEAAQEENRASGTDDAIEMSEDFGGSLEDIPEGVSPEEDDESDAESAEDPEERVDNLDPTDPSALDEKIWGNENGPQDARDTDKAGKDNSEEQNGASDVVAKEDDRISEKNQGEEKQKEQGDQEPEVEEHQGEDGGEPDAAGAPMNESVQDANTLDLPDDMELDVGGDEGKNASEDEAMGEEELAEELLEEMMKDHESNEGSPPPEDKRPDGIHHEAPPEDKMNDQNMEVDSPVEAKGDEESTAERTDEGDPPEEVIARPDTSTGGIDANPDDGAQAQDQAADSTGQVGGSASGIGRKATSQEKVAEQAGPDDGVREQPIDDNPEDGKGNATSGIQEGHKQSFAEQKATVNPLRSLGDMLKEIRQQFEEILDSETTDQPKNNIGPSGAPSQLEYLQPEDTDQEMQALGPAGEEQVAKLDDLKFLGQDGQPELDSSLAMDIDEHREPEHHEKPIDDQTFQSELSATALREDVQGAVLPNTAPTPQQPAILPDLTPYKTDIESKADIGDEADEDAEAELRRWQAADFPDSKAEHMWNLYESMTHDLAYTLCEQLRLILEPTLATRLKGDFRTGKRLNMKKIIPYIASDYTKDKIWLRRAKPSQREYQVLIAIDDSRSMAESHSIHLAYQTLALISKALSRLEAGDIAIAKFGGAVDLLHSFNQGPFTGQAGTQVVNAFTFKQKTTNVLSLVETSLVVLENARELRATSSSSAADLWQLEIIISDGICQDHDELRAILRKAEEQRVMIVFIILDSLHSNMGSGASKDANAGSILTMTKADFKNIDGKMEMQLQKYLDSFPFEYYVVLRNVEALPEVLASTLKQFFERVSEE